MSIKVITDPRKMFDSIREAHQDPPKVTGLAAGSTQKLVHKEVREIRLTATLDQLRQWLDVLVAGNPFSDNLLTPVIRDIMGDDFMSGGKPADIVIQQLKLELDVMEPIPNGYRTNKTIAAPATSWRASRDDE